MICAHAPNIHLNMSFSESYSLGRMVWITLAKNDSGIADVSDEQLSPFDEAD